MRAHRKRLTQRHIDTAKPREREYTLWDATTDLGYRVRPSGTGSFYLLYRDLRGKQRRFTIGPASAFSLDQARKKAREVANLIHCGEDPAAAKSVSRESTLASVWDKYNDARVPDFCPAHQVRVRSIFQSEILPRLGSKPISAITRGDVRELTDKKRSDKKPAMANNIHRVLSAFLTWCHVDRDYLDANPLYGIPVPSRHESRDRVLQPPELAAIWRACAQLNRDWCAGIRLMMLTGLRRTEVMGAETREIDFDQQTWTIPKERSKNRSAHTVYLSAQAAEIIRTPAGRNWKRYLFESKSTTETRSVAGTNASIRKLKTIVSIEDWCLHDLRRSFATHVASMGIPQHVIAVMLNHRSGFRAGVTAIYNRYTYAEESRAAWALWGATLSEWVAREYPPAAPRMWKPVEDDDAVVI